jgi:5-hydroxyisourate hydrolase
MSHITTHVLDTATGKPAEGISITLEKLNSKDGWDSVTKGVTNADGRVSSFLAEGQVLTPGVYRMKFFTKAYFEKQKVKGFYPFVPVVFEIEGTAHYHVPLLLSPFGYSTYRGS